MPNKKKARTYLVGRTHPKFCDATGLPIICIGCYRIPKLPKRKVYICDFHRAIEQYRDVAKIDDNNKFNLPHFIENIEWDKLNTSCQPDIAMLYKQFKRTNADIARRVI